MRVIALCFKNFQRKESVNKMLKGEQDTEDLFLWHCLFISEIKEKLVDPKTSSQNKMEGKGDRNTNPLL